jgi:hypothetical protein
MLVRVLLSGAAELHLRTGGEREVFRLEPLLRGENQGCVETALGERSDDG